MSKTTVALLGCFVMMTIVFAVDIAVQYYRIKRRFMKELARVEIAKQIYVNQEITIELCENKCLASYPVIREYVRVNELMADKLETGVEIENFPVRKKKTNEMTSRERKLADGMLRELANACKSDKEVFNIASKTAVVLEKIYQFQHPVKFQVYHIKTKVTVKILLVVLKLLVELNRMTKSHQTRIQKEMDNAEKSDMLSYSFN